MALSWFGDYGSYFQFPLSLLLAITVVFGVLSIAASVAQDTVRVCFQITGSILLGFLIFIPLIWISGLFFGVTISAHLMSYRYFYWFILFVGLLFLVASLMIWLWQSGNRRASKDASLVSFASMIGILVFAAIWLLLTFAFPDFDNLKQSRGIMAEVIVRFMPVWIALFLTFAISIYFKSNLGLYGKLFDSVIGMIGFFLVMFWVYTGLFTALFDLVSTHDPLAQIAQMKNKVPGWALPEARVDQGLYPNYLLGGDNLGRDVFSRMVKGSWVVIQIAPLAALFAYMVGITLGLPAGYYGGKFDTVLSFLANLILAFPVILLFYLLVTPEIVQTGIPAYMAAVLFIFPMVFVGILLNSKFVTRPEIRTPLLIVVLGVSFWLYASLVSEEARGTIVDLLPSWLDLFNIPGGVLVVFVSVVFVNSPTIFRIVRGLTLDVKSRDYVSAAQTRGESPWYIMLWEILPNVRGPLIVDFCLRIGYTTILLGTLGFFGLGLPPESPDWGSTINDGRRLLSVYLHPPLAPAFALLSLVLGLNLLADGLREESLKD